MSPLKVLMVDSSRRFRHTAAGFLIREQEVGAVETAAGLEQALPLVSGMRPDLLIVDCRCLTRGPVDASFAKIREQAPGIIIIIMTLFTPAGDYAVRQNMGVADGLVSRQDFAEGVKDILSKAVFSRQHRA